MMDEHMEIKYLNSIYVIYTHYTRLYSLYSGYCTLYMQCAALVVHCHDCSS